MEDYENHKNVRNQYENHAIKYENLRNQCENHENHENLRNACENN